MKRTWLVMTIVFLVLGIGLRAQQADSPRPAPAQPAHELLAGVVRALAGGGADFARVGAALDGCMKQARAARAAGEIDAVFLARYTRLLGVIKLSLTQNDKEGILWPVFQREVFPFIESVEGRVRAEDLQSMYLLHGNVGLGGILGAVLEEIVNLRILLGSREKRGDIQKEYQQIFMTPKT